MRVSFTGTKLHKIFVEKNKYIESEYNEYIRVNSQDGKRNRALEWIYLVRLNLAYFILNRRTSNYFNENNQEKLPYLEGSESEAFQRKAAIHLARDLLAYDVISFDIFDTLILRPFAKPADLFMVIGNKLGIMNFYNIRSQAEQDARMVSKSRFKTTEITIYDIYRKVAERTGIDVEKGIKAEFETELEFCFANPYMFRVFKLLKDKGKQIIITSDMYYPHDMMDKLLSSCGYSGYDKLYISCDYFCNKHSGELYKNILHDFPGKMIAHVGDNYNSDINSAKTAGLYPFFYKSCHAIGNPYRADGMSSLIGSFYAGIVNTHLHNGNSIYNPYYEYGFIYGGLYVLGYCNWIHKKAKAENIDKILFLSRDGYIYQKVFNILFDDIPNEYVYWSRIANIKATAENNRAEFLKRTIYNKAHLPNQVTLGNVLKSISLEHLVCKLAEYGLMEQNILVPELIDKMGELFINNWDTIVETYRKETEQYKKLFCGIVSECKRIAVIDVGWFGTGVLGIKNLIEKKWKMECEVKCYVAALATSDPTYISNEMMNEEVEPYMFSHEYNKNLYDTHVYSNKGANCSLFELFTQANHPSFAGINGNGFFNFDISEVNNYEINTDIHKGILDFGKIYTRFTKKNRYLLNISGHDAYIPFQFVIRNIKLISKVFDRYSFGFAAGASKSEQKSATIGDMLRQKGLVEKEI